MMSVKILFQGDSITDSMRCRDHEEYRGAGYATIVSAKLGFESPGRYDFVNRGVSGDRIVDILARIKRDLINIEPDVVSILIGVNDAGHDLDEKHNGVDAQMYELYYRILIEQLKGALPDVRIIILEPFVLKGIMTDEIWEPLRKEVELRAEAAKRVATDYGIEFIPLMKLFDDAASLSKPEAWLIDGVHPTAAGHELIAREWIKVFKNRV